MMNNTCLNAFVAVSLVLAARAVAEDWSQFRGPNASGRAAGQSVATEFGPEKNLAWRCPLPRGLSSPCIRGDHIYVTAFEPEGSRLSVICIGRDNGQINWQVAVKADAIEKVHKASSPANATAVADGRHVYVYFASCGVFCFSHDSKLVWEHSLPVSRRFNGSGTSPILAGGRLIVNREDDREKYLLALDAETGEEVWKTPHGSRGQSFGEATPVLWKDHVVLHRHYEVAAFNLADGQRRWSIPLKTTAASTPVIENDILYVAAWNNFGEADLQGILPPFAELLKHDKDKDGRISRAEMPWGPALARRPEIAGRKLGGNMPVKFMFGALDFDRDGGISESEWTKASSLTATMVKSARHGMTAIRLAEEDGQVQPEVLWEVDKSVPEVPSPVVIGDHVFMIKNGGILTCIDKQSGNVKYRRRLKAPGPYLASLINVENQVIAASGDGVVTVFRAGNRFALTSVNDMQEPISATPAVADGVLYIRTDNALYALAQSTQR